VGALEARALNGIMLAERSPHTACCIRVIPLRKGLFLKNFAGISWSKDHIPASGIA